MLLKIFPKKTNREARRESRTAEGWSCVGRKLAQCGLARLQNCVNWKQRRTPSIPALGTGVEVEMEGGVEAGGSEIPIQGHHQLQHIKTSLGYMRPCFKKEKDGWRESAVA